jgi:hypothetical protein
MFYYTDVHLLAHYIQCYEEVQAARENGENSLKISTAMGSKSFFQSWWRCIK